MGDPLNALLRSLAGQSRHDPHDPIVRLAVRLRARDACEYCLLPTTGQYHVDHIIPASRWASGQGGQAALRPGPDHLENYAWCCAYCNAHKGNKVSYRIGGQAVRLFDPRLDSWPEHFFLFRAGLLILGLTDIGRATERALGFNEATPESSLVSRFEAMMGDRYPPEWFISRAG